MEKKKETRPLINLFVVLVKEIGKRVGVIFIFFLGVVILMAAAGGDWSLVGNFLRAVF